MELIQVLLEILYCIGTVAITLMNVKIVSEERFCLKKYGVAYREFMNGTPSWVGIPKSEQK